MAFHQGAHPYKLRIFCGRSSVSHVSATAHRGILAAIDAPIASGSKATRVIRKDPPGTAHAARQCRTTTSVIFHSSRNQEGVIVRATDTLTCRRSAQGATTTGALAVAGSSSVEPFAAAAQVRPSVHTFANAIDVGYDDGRPICQVRFQRLDFGPGGDTEIPFDICG